MPAPFAANPATRRRILLVGASGNLGRELHRSLMTWGEVTPAGRQPSANGVRLDLCDPASIAAAVREVRPDLIINAAAYTDVERAESERDLADA